MIDGQKVSTYDPERFGAWDHIALRWKQVVNILDAFIPNWSLGEERKTSGSLGVYAGDAIHRVVQERDALKAERDALATECAALKAARDAKIPPRYGFNQIKPRVVAKMPELGAPYGSNCQPHPDAPSQNLAGEVTYPEWEGSHTKRVVDALKNALIGTPSITPRSRVFEAGADAIRLLRDYHRTQHEVYEGRDAARKEVEELKKHLSAKQAFLNLNRAARHSAVEDATQLRAKLREFGELLTKAAS